MTRIRWSRCALAALPLLALAAFGGGCSSGTSALVGSNSNARVRLTSNDIQDFDLIVSPAMGPANDPGACTEAQSRFGCSRNFQGNQLTFEFTTTSQASTEPYFVYIRNLANGTRNGVLEIFLDGDRKVNLAISLAANSQQRVARVLRNSADTQ